MSVPKIEEITNILKEEVRLTSEDHDLNKKKFIPQPPSNRDVNKKKTDPEKSGANLIEITKGDVLLNTLTPREQEKEGMLHDNSKKRIFTDFIT